MKSILLVLFLLGALLVSVIAAANPTAPGVVLSLVLWFVLCASCSTPRSARLCATLSATEILADVIEAFKVRFPMLVGPTGFGTDFSSKTAKLNDQIIAHIRTLPSIQAYDATTGYEANAAEASSLFVDIPMTLDQHKHVPVKVDHLDVLSSKKDLYDGAMGDMAFVLGKSVVDYALSKATAANFSYGDVESIANTSKTTMDDATAVLNANGASPEGRFGLVNTPFYNALEGDARIASGDYHAQQRTDNAYGELVNVSGFRRVWEYPDLTTAAGGNLSALFGNRAAIAVASRVPSDPSELAARIGIPKIADFASVADPNSGLTFLGIQWMKSGTFDIYLTVALLYTAAAGSQAAGAGLKCDKAGYRVTTQ